MIYCQVKLFFAKKPFEIKNNFFLGNKFNRKSNDVSMNASFQYPQHFDLKIVKNLLQANEYDIDVPLNNVQCALLAVSLNR